jgi:hypothetical protein
MCPGINQIPNIVIAKGKKIGGTNLRFASSCVIGLYLPEPWTLLTNSDILIAIGLRKNYLTNIARFVTYLTLVRGGSLFAPRVITSLGQVTWHGAVTKLSTEQALPCEACSLTSYRSRRRTGPRMPRTRAPVCTWCSLSGSVEVEEEDRSEDAEDQGTCLYLVQPLRFL